MRFKTKVILVAVPVAVGAVAGVVAALVVRHRKSKREHEHERVMPDDTRASVEELLRLKGEDFVPDGLGTSLYQRKLGDLSDRQLMALYAIVKVVEVMRQRGIDAQNLKGADREHAARELVAVMKGGIGRKQILSELGSFGIDVVQGIMQDGAILATL